MCEFDVLPRHMGQAPKMSQTQDRGLKLQLPEYCELSQAIRSESRLNDVLGGGSRIVISHDIVNFVKSSIFDDLLKVLSVFRNSEGSDSLWWV